MHRNEVLCVRGNTVHIIYAFYLLIVLSSPDSDEDDDDDVGYNPPPSYGEKRPTPAARKQPCAEALYDFEPENEGELGFEEGQMITLTSRIDENWLEGECNGEAGYFPSSYVKIIQDLP